MFLAGIIPVRDDLVRQLAVLVDDDELATRLQSAVVRDVKVLALETDERETILAALEEAPEGLELRATLLQEHAWRRRGML